MIRQRVTIKDLAEALNISIGTVDRALHGRPGINDETRQKVLIKAAEMGYEVNRVAQSLSRKKPIRIGAIFPGKVKYFYDDVEKGILAAEKELRDHNVQVICLKTEKLGFGPEIMFAHKLLKQGIDGLSICPGHRIELNSVINELADNGIPVVTIATDAPESKRLTCISTDSYKNGEMAGELMAHFVGGRGKVAVMTGYRAVTDHEEKLRGFCDMIAAIAPDIAVAEIYETLDSDENIYDLTLKAIHEIPGLAGIYVNTANSPGACRAIEDIGKTGAIKLVTTDLFPENRIFLEKGVIQATIYQSPFKQGHDSIYALYENITTGKTFPRCSYIKPEIVMRSNLEFYA